jgi:hypothetical protein
MARSLVLLLLLAAGAVQAQDAGALRARHASLTEQLARSPFGRPLHVDSEVAGNRHRGEINAVLEQPFAMVASALARASSWCEILTLQVNVKRCESAAAGVSAHITRRARDPVDDAHRIDFFFDLPASRADYLQVRLRAGDGPVGTRDYEIRIEVAPLDARRTFLRMSYAYSVGTMARLAMDFYLAGPGRDKRGFSVEGGERGIVERSAMRHYLAIEAYVGSKDLETRLRRWYEAITRYPQLQERVSLDEYVEMKRREASLS